MLVNTKIYINGCEVVDIDDFTAQLMNGKQYIWGNGERDLFLEQIDAWLKMPFTDRGFAPTYKYANFTYTDERVGI